MDRKLAQWFAGRDTGQSSKAIALFLSAGVSTCDVPHDAADFGRCHRLLAWMGWQGRIAEMAKSCGRWAVLTEIWPEITSAYEAEDWKEVYRLIKSVEADGYERDGYTVERREDGSIRSAWRGDAHTFRMGGMVGAAR